jgi:hypothetical protein
VRELHYRTVHEDLIEALPELRRPYERLVEDWDGYGGEPPGQYIVFPDTLGKLLRVLLMLDDGTPGRGELLRRALDFGEEMLGSDDAAVEGVAIDSVADTLDGHPAGRDVAERFGGPRLKRWFQRHSRRDWGRPATDEIIDLWGVRAELADRLPGTRLQAIPGISHPADYLALATVEEAQAAPDGVVLLSTFGTTRLYVVVPARRVAIDDATLHRAAQDLAAFLGGEDPTGDPGVRLRRIPMGERVWNMDRGDEKHARLGHDPWIAGELEPLRPAILDHLAGRTSKLAGG